MSIVQAVVLSALQGFTELFPFSSLGIQTIVPHVLHWDVNTGAPQFLPFLVALHMGTAVGLIVYFAPDWAALVDAFFRSLNSGLRDVRQDRAQKTVWLLIVATIPAGLVGLAFKHRFAGLLAHPLLAAALLVVNGLVMAFGDRLVRHGSEDIPHISFGQAFGIGVAQVLALLPGISRSGVTMVGGLLFGLSYETAARFSFLMATPIILAAGVAELPKLHAHGGLLVQGAVGFVVAGLVAYLSVRFLMRYFQSHRLLTLAWISVLGGVVLGALLVLGV
jgi:undecaprenyl-diphosphatase